MKHHIYHQIYHQTFQVMALVKVGTAMLHSHMRRKITGCCKEWMLSGDGLVERSLAVAAGH